MMRFKFILILVMLLISVNKGDGFTNRSPKIKNCSLLTATYYHAVKSQCDNSPLVTADGSRINKSKLKNGSIRWVALSRDLIKSGRYKYGDKVYVYSDNKNLRGTWWVHDTMNKRHKNRIDFLFHESIECPIDRPEKVLVRKVGR